MEKMGKKKECRCDTIQQKKTQSYVYSMCHGRCGTYYTPGVYRVHASDSKKDKKILV